jgi:hypothetical protein
MLYWVRRNNRCMVVAGGFPLSYIGKHILERWKTRSSVAIYFISLRALFDWLFPFADFRFKLYYRWTLTFTTSGIVSISQLINCRIWKFMYKYYRTKWLYKYTCCLLSCEIYESKSFMRIVCACAVLQWSDI